MIGGNGTHDDRIAENHAREPCVKGAAVVSLPQGGGSNRLF